MPYKNIVITSGSPVQVRPPKQDQFYIGFSTVNSSNPGNKLFDFELVKQNLINHFNTRKGERVMNPDFGCVIWELLFEPLTGDVRDLIQKDIIKICESDPRAFASQIDIREYEQGFMLELTLETTDSNQSNVLKLAFDQKLGLQVQ
jgi:phage baseplate assembly protein W